MRKQLMGLYDKYEVKRRDGQGIAGQKHHGCHYFVLDLDHDKFAGLALLVYAMACEGEYPALARDLNDEARRIFRRLKGEV